MLVGRFAVEREVVGPLGTRAAASRGSRRRSSTPGRQLYIYIYIYIYREREREILVCVMCVYIHVYIYIYIYIYIHIDMCADKLVADKWGQH